MDRMLEAWTACLGLSGAWLLACGPTPDQPRDVELGVSFEGNAAAISGTFADDAHALRFRSQDDGQTFEVEVEVNGMTLTASLDADGELVHDGFVTNTGADTQMNDADREALARLSEALEAGPAPLSPALGRLSSFANTWSEFPTSKSLRGEVYVGFRGHDSMCPDLDTSQMATHDDGEFARGSDASTTDFVWIGMQEAGSCDGGTHFWIDDDWRCVEVDHDPEIEYAFGNCFGRCGAGCANATRFTRDCLDHDQCVRTGHSKMSSDCADEFGRTIDDWAVAPNCHVTDPEVGPDGLIDEIDLRGCTDTDSGPAPLTWLAGFALLGLTRGIRRKPIQ